MYRNQQFENIENRLDELEENAEMSEKLDGILFDEFLKLKAEVEKISKYIEENNGES